MLKDNEEFFLFWLKGRVSPVQLSELHMAYKSIDEFCMRKSIIAESLLKITDLTKIGEVKDTIEHNRVFKFENRKDLKKIYSAIKYYILFLNEKFNVQHNEEFVKTNEKNNSINTEIELVDVSEKVQEINFDNIADLSYTKPIYASYFDEPITEVFSWKQLYVNVFKKLHEDYDERIPLNESFNGNNGRIDFCTGNLFASMTAPRQIDADRYLETNLSATDIVRKLKILLNICLVDYDNLIIRYEKKIKDSVTNKIETYNTTKNVFSVEKKTEIRNERLSHCYGNNDNQKDLYTINFRLIGDLSYTKPVFAFYFEEPILNISSWKQLYVGVFKKIYEDYGSQIPLNKPFNGGNNRMDFCSEEYYSLMTTPKQIVTNRYLETNLSATDIVHKIKMLLNICNIDEENLFIRYQKKVNEQVSNNFGEKKRIINNNESELFFEWLCNEHGIDQTTCRSYVSAVNIAQGYALEHGFNHHKLYTTDYDEALATATELFENKEFVQYNEHQHNRFRASIEKLLQFIESSKYQIAEESNFVDLQSYKDILLDKFSKGYRLGSLIELRRFKRFWEEQYDTSLDLGDDSIIKNIKRCGVIHEEKLHIPEIMLDDETKTKLFSYIKSNFLSGKKVIYFEALFNEFSNDFLGHTIYNSDMLRSYLAYMNEDKEFYVDKNYISKKSGISSDLYDEVKNCLIQQAIPVEYEQIFQMLSHIPRQKIKTIIATNTEFISNARNEYFHFSVAAICDDELDDISQIISQEIETKDFISGNELVDFIKKKYPYIIEQNSMLSDKGLRGVIAYKLNDTYSFKGNIISKKGQNLSMREVFADFCKEREFFTLDELKVLKKELETIIYFEAVYENSLRVSKDQFVSKKYVNFVPEEMDKAIDRFCPNEYIPISRVSYFGTFPYVGFQWNGFLLEHYVAMYSPNYKLIHSNYNENICVGAIVKKTSNINSMDDLIIDVLVSNKLPLQKEESLNYLCEEGYLGRRTYTNIEHLLIKAKELRNQKGL